MKLVLFAVLAFHFANFGEANYCDCTNWQIGNMSGGIVAQFLRMMKALTDTSSPYVELPHSFEVNKLIKTWGNDGCFDFYDLMDMFDVSQ